MFKNCEKNWNILNYYWNKTRSIVLKKIKKYKVNPHNSRASLAGNPSIRSYLFPSSLCSSPLFSSDFPPLKIEILQYLFISNQNKNCPSSPLVLKLSLFFLKPQFPVYFQFHSPRTIKYGVGKHSSFFSFFFVDSIHSLPFWLFSVESDDIYC